MHTFCHITQLKNEVGQINFWVSGDTFPKFDALFCDLVFVIGEKEYWTERNRILSTDKLVDNPQCYEHHYKWGDERFASHHRFERRKRYTLKAEPESSFQPQCEHRNLIDILPFLISLGYSKPRLQNGMNRGKGSKPLALLDGHGKLLHDFLFETAKHKLTGRQLVSLHPNSGVTKINSVCDKSPNPICCS